MYYDDHPPPHFHAVYGQQEAQVGIDPITILNGQLPRQTLSMIFEWSALHQRELMQNWVRLQANEPAEKIEPLE